MNIKKSIICITGLLFLAGQVIASERLYNHRPDQVTAPLGMNEVVFVDHALNRQKTHYAWQQASRLKSINISLEKSAIRPKQTGFSNFNEVIALFRNHTDYDYVLEARTHFFDVSEFPSDEVSKWKRVYIPANSIQSYQVTSVDERTQYYRIEVRSAK